MYLRREKGMLKLRNFSNQCCRMCSIFPDNSNPNQQCLSLSSYTKSSLLLYRIPELFFLIITGGISILLVFSSSTIKSNKMAIPTISYSSTNFNMTIQNPTNSYAIKLNEHICSSIILYSCISRSKSGLANISGCCDLLYNKSVIPYEQVSDSNLIVISIIIPFITFIIRAILWRLYIAAQYPSNASGALPVSPSSSSTTCMYSLG
jgi:hypothetical protein